MMCTKNERLDCISTSTSPRIESVLKRSGSFAESIILPSPYPRQELQSNSFLLGSASEVDCDSLSSGSGSGSDHDDNDDDSKEYWTRTTNHRIEEGRTHEPSASGSFAESVSPQRTKYPQSCLIPSLSNTPEELSMAILAGNIPPPPPPPQSSLSLSSTSSTLRRQLFFPESNSNLISQEEQEINVTAVQHPPSPPPIPSNNNTTHKGNSTINTNDDRLIQENTEFHKTFSTVEWLQTTTECYGNAHLHTVLPVVLEEDEGGAISSSPDQQIQKRKECESKSESDSKIESNSNKELELNTIPIPIPIPITKTRSFCSSTNGESLHTILSTHNSCHDDHDNNNHHSNNHKYPLKVDPTTDTIGSDTYQTQSISNNSSYSTFSKDLESSPNPSTPTSTHDHGHDQDNNHHHHHHTHHLEEELDSRLEVIMALKDVVLDQSRASKKVTRENRKITSKLVSKTKANRKLNRRNRTLEEQVEALQRELGEMKDRVVEVEHDLGEERRWQLRRELGLELGERLGGEEEKDDKIFDDCDGGGYINHRNSDLVSF